MIEISTFEPYSVGRRMRKRMDSFTYLQDSLYVVPQHFFLVQGSITMVKFIALLVNLTLAMCTAAAPVDLAKSPTCYSGLYILVARGSTASTDHSNKSGKFADLVVSKVPDSTWVKVDYPASLYVGNYDLSVAKGVMDTEAKIKAYVAACGEESRIALIGYSQGAHVMMNLLSGPAHFDRSYKKPKPLDESYRKYSKLFVICCDKLSGTKVMVSQSRPSSFSPTQPSEQIRVLTQATPKTLV